MTDRRMPAEWERHERCLMAWPARAELWGGLLEQAKDDYATIAATIARYEPVLMLARPGDAGEARQRCAGSRIEVVAFELDDSWTRDSGPLVVWEDGALIGVDFGFNGWGGKYVPFDRDATLARRVLELLEIPRDDATELVLEGGAITVDGEGTLIATETAVLNDNRNAGRDGAGVEALLRTHLGIEKVIWLSAGLTEDRDTDGHVDNVCHFVAPATVLVQTDPDPAGPNHATLAANARRLRDSTDARGRPLEVTELPILPYLEDERPTVVPYLNLYLANDAAIVPTTGADAAADARALELIADALPGRDGVPGPGATLARGGGGVHCITQQVPAA